MEQLLEFVKSRINTALPQEQLKKPALTMSKPSKLAPSKHQTVYKVEPSFHKCSVCDQDRHALSKCSTFLSWQQPRDTNLSRENVFVIIASVIVMCSEIVPQDITAKVVATVITPYYIERLHHPTQDPKLTHHPLSPTHYQNPTQHVRIMPLPTLRLVMLPHIHQPFYLLLLSLPVAESGNN